MSLSERNWQTSEALRVSETSVLLNKVMHAWYFYNFESCANCEMQCPIMQNIQLIFHLCGYAYIILIIIIALSPRIFHGYLYSAQYIFITSGVPVGTFANLLQRSNAEFNKVREPRRRDVDARLITDAITMVLRSNFPL